MPIYKLLACESFRHVLPGLLKAAGEVARHDVEWLPMGLHERPERLHAELQRRIDACAGMGYDAILLAFGLCGTATEGLRPPADSVLVIPRVHDCTALFLGSAEECARQQADEAGTFWFHHATLRDADGTARDLDALGAAAFALGPAANGRDKAALRQAYTEQFGAEAAEYLLHTLLDAWKKNYTRAVYLMDAADSDDTEDARRVEAFARENGWKFEKRAVDTRLLRRLLTGPWGEEFVLTQPTSPA